MIIVLGSVLAKPSCAEDAVILSREHVNRSRNEAGCISHDVFVDPENARHLQFVERWVDEAALKAHFALEASQDFVRKLGALAASRPALTIYKSEEIEIGAGPGQRRR